ncbi:right-handed parallel beta-helix repeat-containing protein [uncultured Bacteroides sp.]|uniref:right-handed parallel beta-helix repeat-containing protein n=1 Tax=uncultured Bacteroides sp. TaxID=162156 RepID=UPI00263A05B9|nr:right-handed parallel beta-helix repeat-containing protein [uncultured Bacteroides sp.]
MKTKNILEFNHRFSLCIMSLGVLFMTLFFCSCSDEIKKDDIPEEEEETKPIEDWVFKIEGWEDNIEARGGSRTIKIYSNREWRISSNRSWVTLNSKNGKACPETPIEVQVNTEFNFYDDREATITSFIYDGFSNGKKEFVLKQPKYKRKETKYQVGDPEVTFDESKFSENYKYNAQMQIWRQAGKQGGIPHLEDQLKEVTKVFEPGTNFNEIKAYFENNKYEKVVALLKNGNYTMNTGIRLYNNAVLIGESRDGVIITIDPKISPKTFGVISMYNGTNVGLRNVTVIGGWLNEDGQNYPKDDNLGKDELPAYADFMTVNMRGSKNCYVDNVKLINNASHSIWVTGNNNTIRNAEMDRSFCKGGGGHGYFFIGGSKNLITNCRVSRLRHLSFQDPGTKQNVLYDNELCQEVTFHNNDGGDNLVENNRVYLPSTMSNAYNAIMGPWATIHKVGKKNFIYKNRCKEDNREGKTPWSDDQLYLGPYEVSVGSDNPTRYTNFRPVDSTDFPPGGTLYPVVLE